MGAFIWQKKNHKVFSYFSDKASVEAADTYSQD